MPPTDAGRHAGSTRTVPRALLIAAALLMAARIAGMVLEQRRTPPPAADRVTWVPVEQAAAVARAENRPLLYDFSAEWCGPCKAMERELFADSTAAGFISRDFVPVRVVDRQREEGRNSPTVDSLQRAYGVQAFPTLVVASPDGGSPQQLQGYRGIHATLAWLSASAVDVRMRPDVTAPGLPGR